MSERPTKRLRRISTTDSEDSADFTPPSKGATTSRNQAPHTNDTISVARAPRRAAAQAAQATTAIMQRYSESPEPNRKPIRLTNKNAPPSRLREVTNESDLTATRKVPSRSSKNKAPIIDDNSDEEDEEEEEEEEEEDEPEEDEDDDPDVDDDEEMNDSDEDEEDEDEEVTGPVPSSANPPRITIHGPTHGRKPSPGRALGATKSVEEKEMQEGSSDEPLTDPDEDLDEDEDDEGDEMEIDNDRNDTIRVASLNDDDLDTSDDDSLRSGTPDPSKLTRRQRGAPEAALLALSNEAQKKKFFTDEQITMRRAEMARRRKDLSEKRNEEEKADTLKRLLEKQPPKRRSKAQMMADAEREEFGGTPLPEGEITRPSRAFIRTVINDQGTRIGVPEEWSGQEIGKYFDNPRPAGTEYKVIRKFGMVEEIE